MIRTIKNRIRLFACSRKLPYRYLPSIRIIQWIRWSRRRIIIITNPLLQFWIVVPVISTNGIIGMRRVFRSLSRDVLPCHITARRHCTRFRLGADFSFILGMLPKMTALIPLSGFINIPVYPFLGGRPVSVSVLNYRFGLIRRVSLWCVVIGIKFDWSVGYSLSHFVHSGCLKRVRGMSIPVLFLNRIELGWIRCKRQYLMSQFFRHFP